MKPQIYLTTGGFICLILLFIFGKTETQKSIQPHTDATPGFNINQYITNSKSKLSNAQILYVSKLENSISRGDLKKQLDTKYLLLQDFWKDSVYVFPVYAYYVSEYAKLVNSEKNLTFAARLMLDSMRAEADPLLKGWEAERGAELFEKAISVNPNNDDLKIGLASCYIYGKGMIGDPSETMKGIQQLLQVVRKDSNNMKAQLVLGIGGVISRQYDKAIERLQKVVAFDNSNLEAVSYLADAYAAKNDKINAKKWYNYSKSLVNNPEYSRAVDERIKALE